MARTSNIDESKFSEEEKQKAVDRREYQRRYYQTHKEKAKEYQRQYNLTHKKKSNPKGSSSKKAKREVIHNVLNTADLMRMCPTKLEKEANAILKDKKSLVP